MKQRTAIVTLAIGAEYRRLWHGHCRANWARYAERCGFDLIAIEEPLDSSPRAQSRSPAWQKLLLAGQSFAGDYERLIWLDADILIHPQAPSVVEGVPVERVGGVSEFESPTPEVAQRALRTWFRVMEARGDAFCRNETPAEFYRAFGLPDGPDRVVNTGVLVFSPRRHRELFEAVYHGYEDIAASGMLAEMRPLSYELVRARMVHWLDPRFNLLWGFYKASRFPFLLVHPDHPEAANCAAGAFAESHFLHFAGFHREIALVDPEVTPTPPRRSWFSPSIASRSAPPRCEVPVALILFNRPETTARVMEAIRAVRPPRLFLIADGPRAANPADVETCAAARRVAETVDWDCVVTTQYASANLGVERRVNTGLDWLFDQVDEAVILEDDCLPEPSFFRFCAELLERYRDDRQVMTISGSSFTFGLADTGDSYDFSRYPLIWGWATWRRAWRLHGSARPASGRSVDATWLESILDDPRAVDYWAFVLDARLNPMDTWDYDWMVTCWRHGGLAIHPSLNLVSNIGFGGSASHTHDQRDALAEMATEPMAFPLRHPASISRNATADRLIERIVFSGSLERMWMRLRAHRRNRVEK